MSRYQIYPDRQYKGVYYVVDTLIDLEIGWGSLDDMQDFVSVRESQDHIWT